MSNSIQQQKLNNHSGSVSTGGLTNINWKTINLELFSPRDIYGRNGNPVCWENPIFLTDLNKNLDFYGPNGSLVCRENPHFFYRF